MNERQYGFRESRDTTTAIAIAYEEIALALTSKRKVNVVLRDVAKAFYKVWHPGMTHRLLQLNLSLQNFHSKVEFHKEAHFLLHSMQYTHHLLHPQQETATTSCMQMT